MIKFINYVFHNSTVKIEIMSHFDRIEGILNEDQTITNGEENQEAQNMKELNTFVRKASILVNIGDKQQKI